MAAALILPFYIVPSAVRATLRGPLAYAGGVMMSDIVGSLVVGFLTSSYALGVTLYLGATLLELLLLFAGYSSQVAIWLGDLVPALTAIYYAQQLYINVGD
jgi:hypothetical protein